MTKNEWLKAIETTTEELASTYYPYERVYIMPQSLLDQMLYQTYNSIPIEWIEKQIKTVCDNIEAERFGKWLIKEWRKENK